MIKLVYYKTLGFFKSDFYLFITLLMINPFNHPFEKFKIIFYKSMYLSFFITFQCVYVMGTILILYWLSQIWGHIQRFI